MLLDQQGTEWDILCSDEPRPVPPDNYSSMTQEDRLDGWKQIADHLKVSQKTAHRWEKEDNLPVIRRNKRRNGPVLAKKSALDAWLHGAVEATVLEDNQLVAKGRSDRILWTYNFPNAIRHPSPEDIEWRIQRVDFHSNSERGVLVAVRFLAGKTDTITIFPHRAGLSGCSKPIHNCLIAMEIPSKKLGPSGMSLSLLHLRGAPYGPHWHMRQVGQVAYCASISTVRRPFNLRMREMSNGFAMYHRPKEGISSFAARTTHSISHLSGVSESAIHRRVPRREGAHDINTQTPRLTVRENMFSSQGPNSSVHARSPTVTHQECVSIRTISLLKSRPEVMAAPFFTTSLRSWSPSMSFRVEVMNSDTKTWRLQERSIILGRTARSWTDRLH
jgi:hypothetical protein